MRPIFRSAAKLLLAASFAGFADRALAQTAQQKRHDKPVLRTVDQSDMDNFLGDTKETFKIAWLSDPKNLAADPVARDFMKKLAEDCQKTGLNSVPHVLIIGPRLTPPKTLDETYDLAGSDVSDLIGPFIVYRSDLFGGKGAMLTENEALAVADHELKHLKISQDGTRLDKPNLPGTSLFNLVGKNILTALFREKHWQEELASDHNAVALGRGRDLVEAIKAVDVLEETDFYETQSASSRATGETYASWRGDLAKAHAVQLFSEREEIVMHDLPKQHHLPRFLAFGFRRGR